ncbi:MAG TPA: hypothetical protein VGZ29_04835, partial [Terriglobia bacterium]|nr:hypothetical protein [Terriglobia bacterium]
MELIRLDLERWPGPLPGESGAERARKPVAADPAAAENNKPMDLPQQDAVPTIHSAQVEASFAAPMPVANPEGRILPPHDSPVAVTAPALEPHSSRRRGHPEEPVDLPRREIVPACTRLPVEPSFAYGGISTGLFPARGLFYSLVAHGFAIVALVLLWPRHVPPIYDPPKHWELTMVPRDALYL